MLSPVAMLPALLTKKDRCYKRKNQGKRAYERSLGKGNANDKRQRVACGKINAYTNPVIYPPKQGFKKKNPVNPYGNTRYRPG